MVVSQRGTAATMKHNKTTYDAAKGVTIFHFENGRTMKLWNDTTQHWYLNGHRHREDGPAVIGADGTKSWYLNGKLHREDGPAEIWADGSKFWFLNGKRHREDGPAVIWADGSKRWWLNGERQQ